MSSTKEHIELAVDRFFEQFSEDELFGWTIDHFVSFVAENFAGLQSNEKSENIGELSQSQLEEFAFSELSFGLNKPFGLTRSLEKLWLTKKAILERLSANPTFHHQLWRFRLLNVWSAILPERETELKVQSDELVKSIDLLAQSNPPPTDQLVEYFLEKVHRHINYFEFGEAKDVLEKASKLAGIRRMELSGALGRRTHFQQKSTPQLLLKIDLSGDVEGVDQPTFSVENSKNILPSNCLAKDDTLLEAIRFDNTDENKTSKLTNVQSACVLAKALLDRRINLSSNKIGEETTLAYLEEVIRQESCWSVQVRALTERSILEMQNPRRVERACAQLETIVNFLNTNRPVADFGGERLELLFASSPFPFWSVCKLHAKVLLSLGCASEALRIFNGIGLWEEAINCHMELKQLEKAESLVRALLVEKGERDHRSHYYYCLLGDITNNEEYYRKAIEISDDKSARAQASLGECKLRKKQFADAVKHYLRSVEIRPLQLRVWFNLGFAAMKTQDYRTSVKAFHRCVSMEPEHFEAWNNLAASYIHLGQKNRAQKILLEAIKLNWDNPRVWENLVLISAEIGDYKQTIDGIEKLLEIDHKMALNEIPLEMAASQLIKSSAENGDEKLLRSLLSIFSRVNARQSFSPKLLRIYAKLKEPKKEQSEDATAWSAHIQLLEKAFQREYNQLSSQSNPKTCARMLDDLLEIVDGMRNIWRIKGMQKEQVQTQLGLRIRPSLCLLEREFGKNCDNLQDDEFREKFRNVKGLLEQ